MSINIDIALDLRSFKEQMKDAANTAAQMGTQFQKIGIGLSAAVTTPLALIAGSALSSSKELQGVRDELSRIKDIGMSELGNEIAEAFNLKENIQRFSEFVKGLITRFKNLSPAVKKTVFVVAGLAAAIGPVLAVVGTLMTMLPALAALFGAISLPVVAVVSGIVALGAAFIYVKANLGAFADFFSNTWIAIKNVAVESIKGILTPITQLLSLVGKSDLAKNILDSLDSLKGKTKENTREFGSFKDALKSAFGSMSTGDWKFPEAVKEGSEKAVTSVKKAVTAITHELESIKNTQIEINFDINKAALPFIKLKEKALDIHQQIGVEIGQSLTAGLQSLAANSAELIGNFLGDLASGGSATMQDFGKNFLAIVGMFMQDFGKAIIGIGIAKTALDAAISSGNAPLAIAAGIALVAAGKALSNVTKQGVGGSSSGGGGSSSSTGGGSYNYNPDPIVMGVNISGREMMLVQQREGRFTR